MKHTNAYLKGFKDYFDGIGEKENPYYMDLKDGSNYLEWEAGWTEAFNSAKKLNL